MRTSYRTVATGMCIVLLLTVAGAEFAPADEGTKHDSVLKETFDQVETGKLPAGWRIGATRLRGPLPTWQTVKDDSAPSGNRVLEMSSPNHRSGGTFNLCRTDAVKFKDGEISVKFKALQGEYDRGGGIMWRVLDDNNYYVVRFNPLEDNFRFYSVKNGVRRQLDSATVKLSPGWHTMKITANGTHYECSLDDKKLLEGESRVFNQEGGVGLWTKADAVTAFDDFSVKK